MKINWTNYDRTAFAEFLGSDLGQKFMRYLREDAPEIGEEADMQKLAFAGVETRTYQLVLKKIHAMAELPMMPLPKTKFVETEVD